MRTFFFLFFALAIATDAVSAQAVTFIGEYHEASCPSVDTKRMVRMKRSLAEATGWIPAIDCHPDARIRYLGVISPTGFTDTASPRTIHVDEYNRSDGTHVREHFRRPPQRH